MKRLWERKIMCLLVLVLTAAILLPPLTGCGFEEYLSSLSEAAGKMEDNPGVSDSAEDEFEAYYKPITANDVAVENGVCYTDSQILMTTVRTATYAESEALVRELGGEIIGYISATNDYQIQLLEKMTFQKLDEMVEELRGNSLVEDASISYVAQLTNASVTYTNDPWADANEPSDVSGLTWDEEHPEGKNWWPEAIGMPSVWDMDLELKPVKVGIIDSMFDTSNEDLDGGLFVKLWNNPTDSAGNCVVSQVYRDAVEELVLANQSGDQDRINAASNRVDCASHGTHVSGIIAAEADNDRGIAGISQNAQLYGYAMHSEEAAASDDAVWGSVFMFKVALANLLNEGVKVINISLGYNDALKGTQNGDANWSAFTSANSRALEAFLLKYIQAGHEFLIMKSAGNDSTRNNKCDSKNDIFGSIADEAVAKRIIVVGAAEYKTSGYYKIAAFSNTGNRVNVYAPGVDILSDFPTNIATVASGTSMATPVVTGIAALIWGINPDLSAEQVREILIASASASIFSLDDRAAIVRDWINYFEDPTAIINAKICVDLAKNTIGQSGSTVFTHGTLNGVIYALALDGEWDEGLEIESMTLYNESGNRISDIPVQKIVYYPTDHTGAEAISQIYTYTVLLKPGIYSIEVAGKGYGAKNTVVSIEEGDVKTLDFAFENAIDLLDGYWENIIQSRNIYQFFEDGTVIEYGIEPNAEITDENLFFARSLRYCLDGNTLAIEWEGGFVTTLEPVTTASSIQWDTGLLSQIARIPEDTVFFYETDWTHNGLPSDNAMYLVKSDISENK